MDLQPSSGNSGGRYTDMSHLSMLKTDYETQLTALKNEVSILTAKNDAFSDQMQVITTENDRLHSEIQELIQKRLENTRMSVPVDNDEAIKNLQARLELANKEKDAAMEMNKQTMAILDGIRHERATEVSHERSRERLLQESKSLTERLEDANLQMHAVIDSTQKENEALSFTTAQQLKELKSCQEQFRDAKQKLIDSLKREESQKNTISSLNRKNQELEKHNIELDHKCQMIATDKQQLEASLVEAENKLAQALQSTTDAHSQVDNLKIRCATLEKINSEIEGKEMNYLMQIRESSQLLDDALLARDSSLMREKQRTEDVESAKLAMETLVQEVADRVKNEVDKVKSQGNASIRRLMDELESLELECANLRSEADKAKRAKRSVEEELDALSRLRQDSKEQMRLEELQRRTINAERSRDDAFITIEKLEARSKQLERDQEEEKMRLLSANQTLEHRVKRLERETEECQHERLHLLEAVNQYKHDNQALKEAARSARLSVTKEFTASKDALLKEKKQLEIRLRSQEEANRGSVRQLHKMLADQQRVTARWKEESESANERNEDRVRELQAQLTRNKRRCQDLTNKLQNRDENRKLPETLKLEETNRQLRAELHQTQYKLLSATQKLGETQALNTSLTMRDLH